jgi:large subunit ribosomal protein L35
MPKMKTHSGAKKRFERTATGKVRGRHAFTSHILEKKSPKHKRELGRPAAISDHDAPRVNKMLVKGAAKSTAKRARSAGKGRPGRKGGGS